MHLLTSVLDETALSDAAAVELYKRRWKIEVLYRSLKQTQGRRKLLSDSPRHAEVELDWSVMSLWLLSMELSVAADPERASISMGLRAIRSAMAGRGGDLARAMSKSMNDDYQRNGQKKARHWPHKKREKPPGEPKARSATASEIHLAKELAMKRKAA